MSGKPRFHFHTNILLHQRICLRFNPRYSLHDSQAKDFCVIRMGTHFLFHCFPIEQSELSLLLKIQGWESDTHDVCQKVPTFRKRFLLYLLFLLRYVDTVM